MPKIVSERQRRLVYAAANDPKVAKKVGMSQEVARAGIAEDKPGKLPEKVKDGKAVKAHRFGSLAP